MIGPEEFWAAVDRSGGPEACWPGAVVNGEWPVQSLPAGWDPAAVPAEVAVAS